MRPPLPGNTCREIDEVLVEPDVPDLQPDTSEERAARRRRA
jgi:hypothetical protein